jgi:quercetin dioxygenase-like cupin family protein
MASSTDDTPLGEGWRTIANPLSGETVTFVATAEETNGARVVMQIEVAPGGGPAPHAHQTQTEVFEGVAGTVELQLDKRQIMLAPGDTITAPPRVLHGFRNRTQAPATIRVTASPAKNIEGGLRATFYMMRTGLLPKQPLVAALLLHQGEVYLPPLPRWVYWPLIGALARLGHWRGGERVLAQYGARPNHR